MMNSIISKKFYLTFAIFFCTHQSLSSTKHSEYDATPDYLDNLLASKNLKEFINIVHIPHTDFVDPSQRKTSILQLTFFGGFNFYGDILLRPGQVLNPGNEFVLKKTLKLSINKWENGIVPYYISNSYSDNQRDFIMTEIQYTNHKLSPNVYFRPYQNDDKDYVFFFNGGSGCYTNLGNVGGPQVISLSQPCLLKSYPSHEMQHTLGIAHEHNRIDRDDFIRIIPENIPQSLNSQFRKYNSESLVNTGPYDYYSLLSFPAKVPGFNFNLSFFEAIQGDIDENIIGLNPYLSPSDVRKVKTLYN